jgi:hypothetical protein
MEVVDCILQFYQSSMPQTNRGLQNHKNDVYVEVTTANWKEFCTSGHSVKWIGICIHWYGNINVCFKYRVLIYRDYIKV